MTHVKFTRKPINFNNLVDDLFTDLNVITRNEIFPQKYGPVNISENENGWTLELVAPGFEKSDFNINLEKDLLTISAEKKTDNKYAGAKQIRKEYQFNSFKRTFSIDEKVNADNIEAEYVNGVLTLNLPKKEIVKQSAKEINIK